ncbi:hypothetical protein F4805DRAFT_351509 [Annulohypoxylon moriforme]|nr:hypothetical protein F4805DRAFT_351509 [Annulohypoxylon moriforme]
MITATLLKLGNPMLLSILFSAICIIGAHAFLFRYVTRRRENPEDLNKITRFDSCEDVYLDIVAVHGLGAHPYHSWTATGSDPSSPPNPPVDGPSTGGKTKINWLENDDFLKKDFPNARILSFGYNADWFMDASLSTAPQKADTFLRTLSEYRRKTKKTPPIVFIGHSFGGILVKYAIQKAYDDSNLGDISSNIAGMIFLGTPHQGSSVSWFGEILVRLTALSGSDATLLKLMRYHSQALLELKRNFSGVLTRMMNEKQLDTIYSFFETKFTYRFGIPLGVIVDDHSATLDVGNLWKIDTDHSGLNKCKTNNDEPYQSIRSAIMGIQSKLENQKERIAKWIMGSEDCKKHEIDHGMARGKLRQFNSPDETIGKWLIESPEFQGWSSFSESSKPTFWLRGGVGTGKTTITSEVIEWFGKEHHLKVSQKLVYLYCSEGHSISTMFRSMILQLAISANGLPVQPLIANKFYSQEKPNVFKSNKLPLDADDHALITQLCHSYSETVVIIDALDECPEPRSFMNAMQKIQDSIGVNIRLFLSSRLHIPVDGIFTDPYNMLIDDISTSTDMHRYIEEEVESCYNFPKGWNERELKDRLKNALLKHAQGVFRWVELQLDIFFNEHFPFEMENAVKKQLETLECGASIRAHPDDQKDKLYEAYKLLLRRRDDSRSIIISSLRWLLCSERKLTTEEFVEAAKLSQECHHEISVDSQELRRLCSNLVVIADHFEAVKFYHLSVKEYLLDTDYCSDEFSTYTCHALIAEISLWYIYRQSTDSKELNLYIHENVLLHCSGAGSDNRRKEPLRDLLNSFCQEPFELLTKSNDAWNSHDHQYIVDQPYFSIRYGDLNHKMQSKLRKCLGDRQTPRHYSVSAFLAACIFNLDDILQVSLSEIPGDETMKKGLLNDGLYQACANNSFAVVKWLMSGDRNIAKITTKHIYQAAQSSDEKVVRFLLQKYGHFDTVNIKKLVRSASGNANHPKVLKEIKWHFHNKLPEDLEAYYGAIRSGSKGVTSMEFLLCEVNNGFITDKIVGGVLGGFHGCEELVPTILQHTDIPITENLLIQAAGNASIGDKVMEVLLKHAPKKIRITEKVLRTAALNSQRKDSILEHLFQNFEDGINITEDIMISAAEDISYRAQEYFEILFKYRPRIRITKATVLAAARNVRGHELFKSLLNHSPDIPLTEDILLTIAGNSFTGLKNMNYLLKEGLLNHVTSSIIATIIENKPYKVHIKELQYLLDRALQSHIDESMLEAAARNVNCGDKLIRMLLDRDDSVEIGDRVVEAAAGNYEKGAKILELFFERKPNTEISNHLLEVAAERGNANGLDALLGRVEESRITSDFLEQMLKDAMGCTGEKIYSTFPVILRRMDTTFPVSEDVLIAVFCKSPEKSAYSDSILKMLFDGDRPALISEKVLEVAIRNRTLYSLGNAVASLLKKDESLKVPEPFIVLAIANVQIQEECVGLLLDRAQRQDDLEVDDILEIAARNECYGMEISREESFKLLLQHKENVKITEEVLIAAAQSSGKNMETILDYKMDIQISQEVLFAAAQSSGESMDAILTYQPDMQPSQSVLKAVVSNENWYFFSAMQIFLHYHPDIEITDDVMEAARNNETMGYDLSALLQKHVQMRSSSSRA